MCCGHAAAAAAGGGGGGLSTSRQTWDSAAQAAQQARLTLEGIRSRFEGCEKGYRYDRTTLLARLTARAARAAAPLYVRRTYM